MDTQRIESFQTITIASKKTDGLLIWIIVLAAGVAAMLIYPAMRLGFGYQINYSEGANVYHAGEAAGGDLVYADAAADPSTPLDYPPFSFYLTGAAGKILGSYLIAGRLISLASLLLITILVPILLHRQGVRWKAGIFSGLAVLALFAAYASEFVGMDDPHCLALAITLLGVWVYFQWGSSWLGLALSSLVLLTGLYTTQNVFPALLAIGLDVFLRSAKRGLLWLSLTLLLFALIDLLGGFQFSRMFRAQFYLPEDFSLSPILQQFSRFDLAFLLVVLVAGWSALFAVFDSRLRFFAFYLGFAFISALYFYSAATLGVGHFFDFFLAAGLLLGVALQQALKAFHSWPVLQKAAIGLLPPVLTLALLFHIPDRLPRANAIDLLKSIQSGFQQDAAYLQQQPGRIFCENLLLCYTAGKPMELDALSASELAIRGETDENLILLMFESRQFSLIQLNRPLPDELSTAQYEPAVRRFGALTQNMRIAIARHYVRDRQLRSGILYRARE